VTADSPCCSNCRHYDRKAEVKLAPKHSGRYRQAQFRSSCLVDPAAPKAVMFDMLCGRYTRREAEARRHVSGH
jgi:hypothetical protein